ncbi:hypothetical protein T484DRAFT_1935600 [Baffinella frigidus]|nr:hypothetical protein T484DRAFT_1935600 [Cryptophyta sp. CCMP2293]
MNASPLKASPMKQKIAFGRATSPASVRSRLSTGASPKDSPVKLLTPIRNSVENTPPHQGTPTALPPHQEVEEMEMLRKTPKRRSMLFARNADVIEKYRGSLGGESLPAIAPDDAPELTRWVRGQLRQLWSGNQRGLTKSVEAEEESRRRSGSPASPAPRESEGEGEHNTPAKLALLIKARKELEEAKAEADTLRRTADKCWVDMQHQRRRVVALEEENAQLNSYTEQMGAAHTRLMAAVKDLSDKNQAMVSADRVQLLEANLAEKDQAGTAVEASLASERSTRASLEAHLAAVEEEHAEALAAARLLELEAAEEVRREVQEQSAARAAKVEEAQGAAHRTLLARNQLLEKQLGEAAAKANAFSIELAEAEAKAAEALKGEKAKAGTFGVVSIGAVLALVVAIIAGVFSLSPEGLLDQYTAPLLLLVDEYKPVVMNLVGQYSTAGRHGIFAATKDNAPSLSDSLS